MRIYDLNLINHLTNMIKNRAFYVNLSVRQNSTVGTIDKAIDELDRMGDTLDALKVYEEGIGENIDERV